MDVDLSSGYLIHLNNHADTLSLIGKSPDNDIAISLTPKWNWIGYPKPGITEVDDVLGGLSSSPGNIIKSQYQFAEFNENTGTWIGDLKFFQPGQGYKLFVSSADNLNILKSGNANDQYLKHEYNMTLTATVDFGPLPVSDNYDVLTYVNGELRGKIPLTYVDKLQQFMAFAMIYGDRQEIGDDVSVVLWDNDNQKEIALSSPEISFGIDQIQGTLKNPVALKVLHAGTTGTGNESGDFKTYPNPFSGETTISYSIPFDTHVVLTVFDSFGKEIKQIVDDEQETGHYNYTFKANNLPSGVYFCTLRTSNYVETKKLIIIQD
jgi:hypothetical protein